MQQTKQTRRACPGGAAAQHGAVARQAGAAGRPGTGEPRPSDAVSARATTSAACSAKTAQAKQLVAAEKPACRLGRKLITHYPWPAAWWFCHHPGRSALATAER